MTAKNTFTASLKIMCLRSRTQDKGVYLKGGGGIMNEQATSGVDSTVHSEIQH